MATIPEDSPSHPQNAAGEPTEASEEAPSPAEDTSFEFTGSPDSKAAFAAAFARASLKFLDVPRDAKGHFGPYTSKATIIKCTRPFLAEEGIALLQPLTRESGKSDSIMTWLIGHGAEMKAKFYFDPKGVKNLADYGSMLTYLSRYKLQADLVLEGDRDPDQDGKYPDFGTPRRQPPPAPAKPKPQPPPDSPPEQEKPQEGSSDAQKESIRSLCKALGWGKAAAMTRITELAEGTPYDKLSQHQADKVIDGLIEDCKAAKVGIPSLQREIT